MQRLKMLCFQCLMGYWMSVASWRMNGLLFRVSCNPFSMKTPLRLCGEIFGFAPGIPRGNGVACRLDSRLRGNDALLLPGQ